MAGKNNPRGSISMDLDDSQTLRLQADKAKFREEYGRMRDITPRTALRGLQPPNISQSQPDMGTSARNKSLLSNKTVSKTPNVPLNDKGVTRKSTRSTPITPSQSTTVNSGSLETPSILVSDESATDKFLKQKFGKKKTKPLTRKGALARQKLEQNPGTLDQTSSSSIGANEPEEADEPSIDVNETRVSGEGRKNKLGRRKKRPATQPLEDTRSDVSAKENEEPEQESVHEDDNQQPSVDMSDSQQSVSLMFDETVNQTGKIRGLRRPVDSSRAKRRKTEVFRDLQIQPEQVPEEPQEEEEEVNGSEYSIADGSIRSTPQRARFIRSQKSQKSDKTLGTYKEILPSTSVQNAASSAALIHDESLGSESLRRSSRVRTPASIANNDTTVNRNRLNRRGDPSRETSRQDGSLQRPQSGREQAL